MPPWHVDRTVGIQKFKNDLSLPDAEIETIVKWVDAGAPRGNPADMPPAAQFARLTIGTSASRTSSCGSRPTWCRRPAPDLFPDLFADSRSPRTATSRRSRRVRSMPSRAAWFITPSRHGDRRAIRATSRTDGGQFIVEYASGKHPRSIRRTRACCSRRAEGQAWATTCTRSAKTSTRRSKSA